MRTSGFCAVKIRIKAGKFSSFCAASSTVASRIESAPVSLSKRWSIKRQSPRASCGASRAAIILATAIGVPVGILAALNVSAAIAGLETLIGHKFLNADGYYIDYLPSQVQAQGVLLQQLAQQLSVALKPLANQPPIAEAPRKSAPVQAKPAEPQKPKMPMATPIRTDMEVFRF